MSNPQIAPYGFWKSPITSDRIVAEVVRLGEIALDGETIYWSEGRPNEGGRSVIVRRTADGAVADQTPPSFNVRTRVHEYGGGAFTVHDGVDLFLELRGPAPVSSGPRPAAASRSRRRASGATPTA